MFAKTHCAGLSGIEGYIVEVETNAQSGLPCFLLVGDLQSETKEAKDRVWNALRSSGFDPEPRKTTINLSPAGVKKEGTGYDLAIAVSVLGALERLDTEKLKNFAFFGELGLSGELKPVKGILPLCFTVKKSGHRMRDRSCGKQCGGIACYRSYGLRMP